MINRRWQVVQKDIELDSQRREKKKLTTKDIKGKNKKKANGSMELEEE